MGLRWRMTAALLGISALALVVTAVTLLVPLQTLLRRDAVRSLAAEARTARGAFAPLAASDFRTGSPALEHVVHRLGQQTSAAVAVVDADGDVLAATDVTPSDRFRDVALAIRENRLVRGTGEVPGTDRLQARVAMPVGRQYGVALRKSLENTGAAARVIARALLVSAVIALVVALAAGTALAGRLVRRLTALRDTSLRLADLGPLAEVQDDGARDEVGDLTRAFASMQQRLREQEQARRTFVATASHELRTPVTSLRLMLHSAIEELQNRDPDLEDMRQQLGRAVAQTDRLGALAAELLDLSRLDAGLPLRSERVDLVELSRSVIAELQPRDVRLHGAESAWASADPGAVAQILRILVDNALRYGDDPIEIEVTGTVVVVRDGGRGVPEADADRIFDRFERGADAAGNSGFGLGLAIGRELAHRMGGELTLTGGPPGAEFRLTVPVAVGAAAVPAL